MKIRKFVAANMREAVAQVKRELGDEAMIVATKQVRRGLLGTGVEVTAAIDNEEPAPAPSQTSPQVQPQVPSPSQRATRMPAWVTEPRTTASDSLSIGAGLTDADVERVMSPIRSELRSLRTLIRPLTEDRIGETLRSELIALRQAVRLQGSEGESAAPLAEVAASHTLASSSQRRVIALVGPTGVGKTTTIAKLAARAALVEHRSVAIVTLDTYRVGGEEQIRAFADLMGVPLTVVSEPEELGAAVARLDGYDRIFIDTAGRSPRDGTAIAALAQALGQLDDCEVHLAVAASSQAALIDACVNRYAVLGVERILFTKVDEAIELDEIVRAPARIGWPVTYLTTGQRVPEDLEDATPARLLEIATRGLTGEEVAA